MDLFCWGEVVMIGGSGGWLELEVGEETGGGEVAGDEVADMTIDIFGAGRGWVVGVGGVRCRKDNRARGGARFLERSRY